MTFGLGDYISADNCYTKYVITGILMTGFGVKFIFGKFLTILYSMIMIPPKADYICCICKMSYLKRKMAVHKRAAFFLIRMNGVLFDAS